MSLVSIFQITQRLVKKPGQIRDGKGIRLSNHLMDVL